MSRSDSPAPPAAGRRRGFPGSPALAALVSGTLLVSGSLLGLGGIVSAQEQPTPDPGDGQVSTTAPPSTEAPASTAAPTSAPPSTDGGGGGDGGDNPNDGDGSNPKNLPVHDGTQKGTVFNPVQIGEIPEKTPMVMMVGPRNNQALRAGREIPITARFANFVPGFFSDPKTQYGVKPQGLSDDGSLQGHNHACFQLLPADGSMPGVKCDSFVVLEAATQPATLTGIAPPLMIPGRYRVCVDAASETHYVGLRAFAQQSGPVDCVRVRVFPSL